MKNLTLFLILFSSLSFASDHYVEVATADHKDTVTILFVSMNKEECIKKLAGMKKKVLDSKKIILSTSMCPDSVRFPDAFEGRINYIKY